MGNIKEFDVQSTRNSLGFHDKEYSVHKPPNTFRIVILGDSFVEAIQVPLKKTFHKILEKKLNEAFDFPVEVFSLGRSGNGAQRNYELFAKIGLRFSPDLVIMQFLSNDLIDDNPYIRKDHLRQQNLRKTHIPELKELYAKYLLFRSSRFNQILALKAAQLLQGLRVAQYRSLDPYSFMYMNALIFAEEYSTLWEKAWRKTQNFIVKSRDLAEANRMKFVLVSFPELWRVGSTAQMLNEMKSMSPETKNLNWNLNKTEKKLREFCKLKSIDFVSLLYPFRKEFDETGKRLHFYYDMHLNTNGHRVAAEILYDYLLKKKLIIQP
jgi:lysophospholipase L1-like esterase